MSLNSKKLTNQLTEHLFRNFYQEVFSSLIVRFGAQHIDTIEDALQDTFYKAIKSWKFNDLPSNPKGWLFIVTKNNIINELRKGSRSISADNFLITNEVSETASQQAKEDQLRLLMTCVKFDLKPQAKLVFTLKAICGFGVTEIANSLMISEENVYKQVQRCKQKLKALTKDYFAKKSPVSLSDKDIDHLEQIIYFMFNEGYDSINKSSKTAINREICFEAVRLAHLLEEIHHATTTQNLLALFYFHMARFDSRVNDAGEFVSLRKQDRTLWDNDLIQLGFNYLKTPAVLNRYYIEALIASSHSTAPSFKETNWQEILKLYDALLLLQDTPIIQLNRAICLFELGNYEEGKMALDAIKDELEDSYLYYSVSMAEYLSDKDKELSEYWYKKSLETAKQPFRKELIQDKLDQLN
ncbi:MAG: sigma-70 family RNA polymerase sigma factor [Flavobacteriaceae bacterium]|nr:sigma-70 family RNA polymerase sigma factor [Flavobacteriaceae bacterium]